MEGICLVVVKADHESSSNKGNISKNLICCHTRYREVCDLGLESVQYVYAS